MPASSEEQTGRRGGGLLLEMMLAGVASGVGTVVGNPFEVAKTRLQLQSKQAGRVAAAGVPPRRPESLGGDATRQHPRLRGLLHALRHITVTEGMAGIFSGFAGFAGYRVVMNGVRLGLYVPVKAELLAAPELRGQPKLFVDVLAAASTGAVGACIGNPFNVIKTRCMATGEGPVAVVLRSWRAEGPWMFTLGMAAEVPRVVVGSAAQLTSYDATKRVLGGAAGDSSTDWRVHLAGSVVSSLVSVTCFCPLDVISSRLSMGASAGAGDAQHWTSFSKCLRSTVRHEGPGALMKGWGALWWKTWPTSAATLMLWEYFRKVSAPP